MLSVMKTDERRLAEALRRDRGMSVRQIAVAVGVSRSTASLWLRGIELTPEQRAALDARNPRYSGEAKGAATNAARARARRESYQADGRRRIRDGDPLYLAGCMLYWGEGKKGRSCVRFANSDPAMVALFVRFLRECFAVPDEAFRVRCLRRPPASTRGRRTVLARASSATTPGVEPVGRQRILAGLEAKAPWKAPVRNPPYFGLRYRGRPDDLRLHPGARRLRPTGLA
jgi:hypothetical protein